MKKYLIKFWPLYLITMAGMIFIATASSHMVTTMAENRPILREKVIVIDAGHGGEDGGATSCSGVLESRINLEISLKLDALLHFLGYETKMVRTSDVSVYTEGNSIAAKKASDLKNRVKFVNETEDALLISIHQNIFVDSRYSGAQVFYNAVEGSKELAQALQTAFVASINPESNRKIKPANGVYLMEHIKRPGVLVECGFLSCPEEEAKLRTGEYQQKICCVIVSTVSTFLSNT